MSGANRNDGPRRPRWTNSLRTKILVLMLLMALIPLGVVDIMGYFGSRTALRDNAAGRITAVRDHRANQIQSYFSTMSAVLDTLAQNPETAASLPAFSAALTDAGPDKVRGVYLDRSDLILSLEAGAYSTVHERYAGLFGQWLALSGAADLYLIDPAGNVVASVRKGKAFATNLTSGPYKGENLAALARILLSQSTPVVKAADFAPFGPLDGKPQAFLGRPVMREGKSVGALVVQFGLEPIDRIAADSTGLGRTGQTLIVGADGLLRSNTRFVADGQALRQAADGESARLALAGQTDVKVSTDYRGKQVLSAYRPLDLPSLNWAVVTDSELSEVDAGANNLILAMVVSAGVSFVMVAAAAVWMSGRLVAGMRTVVKAAGGMSVGNLTLRAEAGSTDELGELGRGFNNMAEGLSVMVRRIVDSAARLASSATEISAAANQMSTGAENQAEQVLRTSSSMEEMSAAIQQVARNAHATAKAAASAVDGARQTSEGIAAGRSELQTTNEVLQRLRDRSAEIERLVTLIRDISAQTNLLALNAAIEAAGAGAAGARFDVVAEEIRKLAQRASSSTEEIASTVSEIRADMELAAERMAVSAQAADSAAHGLSEILGHIATVSDMVNGITSSSDQQVRASEQVAESLQWITQVSRQTVQAARETAHTTDDLAALAQDMRGAVAQFQT